jgi:quinol monooxygenase YgiN
MVQLLVRITAATGQSHRLVQALHVLMRRALQVPGCSAAHIGADVEAADVFWYWEDWQDARDLEERMRTSQFSQLLALLETSASAPSVEFRVVEQSRGLDYIAAVRKLPEGAEL